MDRIDDLLFLGCRAAVDMCAPLGFTHRVQLATDPVDDQMTRSHIKSTDTLLYIQLDDDEEASLDDAISRFIAFMELRDERTDRVFLHCQGGVSRSASMALVYLMRFKRMRLSEALPYLHQCRPCVQPNIGFMAQLEEFDRVNQLRLSQ